jgi:hypothetical protein
MSSIQSWVGSELDTRSGIFHFSEECLKEINDTLRILDSNSLPFLTLSPADIEMPCFKSLARQIREALTKGLGFCIVDRLPLNNMSNCQAKTIYWLLAQMIGRPVAQKWSDGRMIYSVTDLGKPSGNGVRPDVTNEEQSFHTDNSYNICPPDHVGLLCLQPAATGGLSRIVNMVSVIKCMNERYPGLVSRLFLPYFFDRQREHSVMDNKTIFTPLLSKNEDGFRVRVSRNLIYQGYKLQDTAVDEISESALEAFFSIVDDPKMYLEFRFEPGQIQFLNNRLIGHKRTSFKDHPDMEMKRKLLRVWLREKGKRFYNG